MLSKSNVSKKLITLFLIFLSVAFFNPIEPSSAQVVIQTPDCRGSILTNGNFTQGLVGGQLNSSGAVSNWTATYGSPDVGVGMGCHDAGYIGMWGNQTPGNTPIIGEAVTQTLSLGAGKVYIGSICFRVATTSNQQSGMVRLRATSTQPTFWGTLGTVYLSPLVPASTNWNPDYTFAFTGTGTNYLTINVESNLSGNDGAKTTYGHVDNVCIRKLVINANTACLGQPTNFTATLGATSYDWDFGDGSPHGTQQNPAHTYNQPGTYTVKLCVNGTTNCITKTVTVTPGPAAPVITGPASACGPAIYSVQALPGFTYAWTISNGTINGSSTGNSVNVIWNSTGVGTITVVASTHGCTSEPATLTVHTCNINAGDCCLQFQTKTDLSIFTYAGNGVYNVTPNLSTSLPGVIQVTADIISASVTYSPAICGPSGPVNAYVVGASNVISPPFTASVTVSNGDEVIWKGSPANVGGVNFPMQIKFPPPPTGQCQDLLTFCIKYTFTDNKCKTCSVIRCYGPFKRGGGPIPDDPTRNNSNC